jgi:hypothetical protein
VSVSTLANGLTVVTEDASTTSTVTMTYPKAGSASEAIDEQGAALINKLLCFTSGSNMSSVYINRLIEEAGGRPFVNVDRAGATLGYTVTPDQVLPLIPTLAVESSFEKWDMKDAYAQAAIVVEDASTSAQIALTENLYAAAFGPQSPAGRSFYCTSVSKDNVMAFRSRAYGVQGAVLAATGISDHASFCSNVSSLLEGAPAGSGEVGFLKYLGGESRVASPGMGYAHVAMAFAAPVSSVLANVVKQVFTIAGADLGVTGFTATGIVGAYAGGVGAAPMDALSKVMADATSAEVLKRAKLLAKAEALFSIDGGSKSLAACMTSAVLEDSMFSVPADIVNAYDAVSDAEVKDAISAMLKSNPSLAAVGDIAAVPYHAEIIGRFN